MSESNDPASRDPGSVSTLGPGPGDQPIVPEAAAAASPSGKRPLIERVGMAGIALVLAALFGGVAAAAFSGGEIFLAVMGAVGCLMTLWVGGLTLFRG